MQISVWVREQIFVNPKSNESFNIAKGQNFKPVILVESMSEQNITWYSCKCISQNSFYVRRNDLENKKVATIVFGEWGDFH